MSNTVQLNPGDGTTSRRYSLYDDLLSSVLLGPSSNASDHALSPQFDADSDVVLLKNHSTNHSLRIGPVLNLVQSQFYGDVDFWDTTHLAMAAAIHDFNARVNPYGDENDDDERVGKCNLYLSMRWALPRGDLGRNLNVVGSYQSEVLLGGNGTRPIAVLGGITSSQSSLLALLGAVASESDPDMGDGREAPPLLQDDGWHDDDDGSRGGPEAPLSHVSKQGVPNMSPFSTAAALDGFKVAPLFSRTVPTNEPDVRILCQYLHDVLGVRRMGILYVNTVYGSNYFATLKQLTETDEYKMNVTAFSFNAVSNVDFTKTLYELKASQITYMVAALHPPTWKGVVRALLDASLLDNPEYAWFFTDSLSPAIGSRWTEAWDDRSAVDSISAKELARALNRTAIVRLSSSNSNLERHRQHLVNYTLDPAFANYFRNKTGVQLPATTLQPSIFSMLAYDAVRTVGLAACRVNETFLRGPDLHQAITSVEFTGASGRVSFDDANTRTLSGLTYEIANVWVDEVSHNGSRAFASWSQPCVLMVSDGGLTFPCNLTFPSGSTSAPVSLPAVGENMNLVPIGDCIVVWTLAGLVVLLSLSCAAWTCWHRNKPVIRASQPTFLVMLCVGTLLIALDMLFLPFQDPTTSPDPCMISVWLLALGFTTIFSALFAKTWRILRVYANARRCRRVSIRAHHVLWPIAILLALNTVVLTLWTVLSPLTWERIPLETNMYGEVISSQGVCLHAKTASATDWIFFGMLLALNAFALVLSNYVSYQARKLPSDFNESKFIFMSNVILLEALIIGIPVLVTVRHVSSTAMVLVRAMLDVILCLGVLLPMFVPKFTKEHDDSLRRFVSSNNAPCDSPSADTISRFISSRYLSKASAQSRGSDSGVLPESAAAEPS